MISHALTIVTNELNAHLKAVVGGANAPAELGNVGDVGAPAQGANSSRNKVLLSVVNIQEERTLSNGPTHVRDDAALRVRYENPPTCVNLAVLVAATHTKYDDALLELSRVLTFFQYRNVFTHDNVAKQSLQKGAPVKELDRLEEFKLVFRLWSPTLEEVNDMWGMLGGKQFPFALYSMRMLELKFRATERESGLITEIANDFSHKAPVS